MAPLPTPLQVLRALRNMGITAAGLALMTMSHWVTLDFPLRETAGMPRAWQGSGEESGRTDRVPSHFTFTLTVSGKESNSVKSRPTSLSAVYGVYSSLASNTCSLVTTARHLEGGNGPRGTRSTQPLKDLQALSWPLYAAFYSLGVLHFTCGVVHIFLMYIRSVYFKTLTKYTNLMIFFWSI